VIAGGAAGGFAEPYTASDEELVVGVNWAAGGGKRVESA
jgi:hypothetical protein